MSLLRKLTMAFLVFVIVASALESMALGIVFALDRLRLDKS